MLNKTDDSGSLCLAPRDSKMGGETQLVSFYAVVPFDNARNSGSQVAVAPLPLSTL